MIGNKVPDKITNVSKKRSAKELHNNDDETKEDVAITTHERRYISPEERQQIMNKLKLVQKYNNGTPKKSKVFKRWIK